MPTNRIQQIQFVRGGDWDARNEVELLHPGELMQKATINDKDYQTVQLDSGATAATPTGAQAAQQIAYFKDRANGVVTNDIRFALHGRNGVAGVFPATVTPGYYTAIYTGRSRNINMKVDGSTFTAGDQVVSDSSGAQGTEATLGTAPTFLLVGLARGASVANVLAVDLMLPDYD